MLTIYQTCKTGSRLMVIGILFLFPMSFGEILFSDGFEDCFANWVNGGAYCSGTYYEGLKSCKMNNDDYVETAVDTTGYSTIWVTYVRNTSGLDSGNLFVSEWYDGTTWNTIEAMTSDFTDWTWGSQVELPASAGDNADFKLRFRVSSGANYAYVDAVTIEDVNPYCAGLADFDCDGIIDANDLSYIAGVWLTDDLTADIAQPEDSLVNFLDLSVLAEEWMYRQPFPGYDVQVQSDIPYLGENRPKLDIYYPANSDPADRFPGIVIIHGGGWTSGDKANSRELNIANTLVPEGYVCVSINYDLGNTSWPQNIHDCKLAVQYLRVNAAQYQIDSDHIGVIGGSAGGHLACMVGYVDSSAGLEPTAPYPNVNSRVQAVVDMYGITNLLTRQETDADGTPNGILKDGTAPTMLGCGRTECPDLWVLASPVSHVTADDPPTLILHGTEDTTVDYDQSIELDSVLSLAGVQSDLHIIDGLQHSFDLQPSGHDLRPLVIDFFDAYLKN